MARQTTAQGSPLGVHPGGDADKVGHKAGHGALQHAVVPNHHALRQDVGLILLARY